MRKLFAVTVAFALLGLSLAAQAVVIDTVAVGNPHNAADTQVMHDLTAGYGSVAYEYNIGKYEVTAGQYTAFLNAAAATDTYSLYNTEMSRTDYGSGITRNGESGSYTYSAAIDFVNRPVNYVSFWDACRFANWLNNGQGSGDTENGAYTITASGIANNTITRNSGWTWAVTSEDEWYKAAYYDPNKAGGGGYWAYPTRSDIAPGQDMADASGNNANYNPDPYSYANPIDRGRYTTIVGQFQDAASPYGTFDQGGNVIEWNEAVRYGDRGLRGGSWDYIYYALAAGDRISYDPTWEGNNTGFRVVQAVPEPSSIIAFLGGLAGLLGVRRRRAKS